MSLRTLIRLLALALVSMPLSVLLWDVAGPWPLLAGLGLLLLTCGYLLLLAGEGDLTRWQLRYQMDAEDDLEHLEQRPALPGRQGGALHRRSQRHGSVPGAAVRPGPLRRGPPAQGAPRAEAVQGRQWPAAIRALFFSVRRTAEQRPAPLGDGGRRAAGAPAHPPGTICHLHRTDRWRLPARPLAAAASLC